MELFEGERVLQRDGFGVQVEALVGMPVEAVAEDRCCQAEGRCSMDA